MKLKKCGHWCKFLDVGQDIETLVKKHGWFFNFCQLFSKSWLLKSIGIILNYYLNPVSNISIAKENSTSRNKDILNTVLFIIKLIKTEDSEHYLLTILPL